MSQDYVEYSTDSCVNVSNVKNIYLRTSSRGIISVVLMCFAVFSVKSARAAFEPYIITGTDLGLNSFKITWDNTTTVMLAGGLKLTKTSDNSQFLTVCLDIGSTLTFFQPHNYSSPTAFDGQTGLNPTWGSGNGAGLVNPQNSAAAIQAAADIFYKHGSVLGGSSLVQQAALQLAVWEALYDTSAGVTPYNLTGGGRFSVATGIPPNNQAGEDAILLAAEWLLHVDKDARYSGSLLRPEDLSVQEVFYTVTPVPEPTTVIAGALLLLPFAATVVRRFRKN